MSNMAMKRQNCTISPSRWISKWQDPSNRTLNSKIKDKEEAVDQEEIEIEMVEMANIKKEIIRTIVGTLMTIEKSQRKMLKRWVSTSALVALQDSKTIKRRMLQNLS